MGGTGRASLPGALPHDLQVVLLQLGSKQGVLVLQLLDLLPQELIVHLQPLGLLERLLHALVGLAQLPDVITGLRQDPSFARSCLAVVCVTIWNDFRKLDDPVVDLVPPPPLHFIVLRSPSLIPGVLVPSIFGE